MASKSNKDKELESNEFEYVFQGFGLDPYEKRTANRSFTEYRKRYHIDSLSDLHLLEELVYNETLLQRIKKQVQQSSENKRLKDENYVPTHLHETVDEHIKTIVMLKEKLGLFQAKNEKDPYKYIQVLKKKELKWMEENQGSRSFPCPHCSKMVMLRIKTDVWESQKHPLFRDKILANEELWKLYKEGILNKTQVAKVLGTPEDYIDWLDKHIFPQDINPS